LAGVFLAAVLVYTGSLYAAWAAHFAWNWMMTGVLHAAVSGASEPLPGVSIPDFRIVDNGPDLVTGGPWGPEGGLMAAVAIGASMVILKRVTDRRREREAVT
jgi:hypothetical protein